MTKAPHEAKTGVEAIVMMLVWWGLPLILVAALIYWAQREKPAKRDSEGGVHLTEDETKLAGGPEYRHPYGA
ncbi:MAG TPA: hypothetical protein VH419_00925 [Nocardioidaceae bacterium]